MDQSAITKLRIPISAALVIGECASLLFLRGHRSFIAFVILSCWALFLTIPLFWSETFWRRGVSLNPALLLIAFGYLALRLWRLGDKLDCDVILGIFTGGIAILFDRLRRPLEKAQQEANLQATRISDWGVPTERDFIALFLALVLLLSSTWILISKPDGSRAIYLLLGGLWFAWLFIKRRLNGVDSAISSDESEF
jgi:hypothetical protein